MLIGDLQNTFSQPGRVVFIGIRPERLTPVISVDEVLLDKSKGLVGDRYHKADGNRQVTLIQSEHLAAASSYLQKEVRPEMVRRNIVTRGINLLALKGKRFKIGETLLEYTGECHPCSRMEQNLGKGGYNAMRGHGGITARIIEGGIIRLNDFIGPVT